MTFWIARLIFDWVLWLIFADKKRWKEILPVCFFASWVSYIVESQIYHNWQLWSYSGQPNIALAINGFGIYIVVTYLFIQWLPENRTAANLFYYLFLWTAVCIVFEYFHLLTGNFMYHKWWNLAYSYLADWILFYGFYKYYLLFSNTN